MLKIDIKQFAVDIRNFTKGDRIGKGGFSEVFLAQYKKTGDYYAAKVCKSNIYKEEEKNKIQNEIDVMINTDHPTIIKYYGYSLLDFNLITNIVIFTEYAKNGSLSKIIAKAKKSRLPADYDNTSRQIILIGVSCGMKYLHHQNIMHRDLNTNNILLDENYYPHITDFGMAKYLHKTDLWKETPIIGTLPYMAPEMILAKRCTNKIDVYSFGILMYEVLCECDLYPSITDKETSSTDDSITNEYRKHIAISHNRPEFNKEIKRSLKELVEKCWSSEAKERPNFDEIYDKLTSPEYFLDKVDQKKVKNYIDFISKSESIEKVNTKSKDSNNGLIEKVNSLSRENDNLRDQIKSLKENNSKIENQCVKLKTTVDEMAKQIENKPITAQPPNSKENEILRDQIKSLKDNNSKLENQCAQLKKLVDELTKKNENKPITVQPQNSKENEILRDQIKSLKDNNSKLENQCAQLKKMLDEMSKKNENKSVLIQPPNSKENTILNSPRFRHQREQKENESLLVKINDDSPQKIVKIINENPIQNSMKTDEKLIQNSMKNNEKNIQNKIVKINDEKPLPSKLIIINDEKQLKQKLMKINDEKQLIITSPEKDVKTETPLKSPIIIVQQKNSNEGEIVNIHQKEVENSPKSPILFTPIKDKINGQLLIPSTSPRRLPQFSNKDDEINLRSLTPQKVKSTTEDLNNKLPQLRKLKKPENPSEITIVEFNGLTLQQQLQIVNAKVNAMNPPQIFLKRKSNQYIFNLHKFLNLFIQFVTSPDTTEFIEIQIDEQDDKLDNVSDGNQLNILSKTTEILYNHQLLDSEEFYLLTKLFKRVSIEIQYFSKIYRIAYKIIFPLNHLKINVFVSGIKKTDNTFKANKYIKSIRFDDSVSCISDYAFENCFSLRSILFSSSITTIGSGSFEGCYSLKSISIPPSVNSIGFSAFKGCSELIEISIPNSIKLIRNNTFYGCKSLKKFVVPSSVSQIGDRAFCECSALESLSIPSSVLSIGESVFAECSALKCLSVPVSVQSIGNGTFKGCNALEQLIIPSSIHGLKKLEIIDDCKIIKV